MEKAKYIDINEYVKSGEGANGSSYDLKSDSNVMVKLYNVDYPTETIFTELDAAKKVFELGIPSPEPGELVTDGSRIGIKFRRIVGKRSFSRMIADEPERVDEYSREFARHCKKLHSTECPAGIFPEAKPQFLHLLEADRTYTDSQREVIADFIRNAPDCGTVLHGDMHIGNMISTLPKGAPVTDPHDIYFIDLGYFARGCPLFDVGMMLSICLYADEEFRRHDFHITGEQGKQIWESFCDEYFFGAEQLGVKWFGAGATPDSVLMALRPYFCAKLLLVEYNLGFMPPHYDRVMRETFGF